MANTTIQLKKSSTPAAKPASLEFGELAINYADGKLYYKNTNSQIAEISGSGGGGGGGGDSFGTVNANGVLVISDTAGDVLTLEQGSNIIIVGDAVNDKITISANLTPANSYAATVGAAANAYANLVWSRSNTKSDEVGTSANAFTSATIAGANVAVGAGANAYANIVWSRSNSFTSATIAGANAAVGTGANAFTSATIAGANAAVGAGANSVSTAAFLNSNNAFTQANTARNTANAAFDKANTASGGAYFQGNNGDTGNVSGLQDIFRVHTNTLTSNVTIYSGNNALAAGPITVSSGVSLTIQSNARVAIV